MISEAGTFGLGAWQAKRYEWKKDMINQRVHGLHDPAISPPPSTSTEAQWNDILYRRVKVNGRFVHSRAFYVGPRSAPSTEAGAGLISASNPQTGYFVITPFVPANSECDTLLVNRGWIPSSLKKQMQSAPDSTQLQSIICVPRPGEKESMFISNDAVNGVWLSMNIRDMSPHVGQERVAPVICDLLGKLIVSM